MERTKGQAVLGIGIGSALAGLAGWSLGKSGKITPKIYLVTTPEGEGWHAIGFPETKKAMLLCGAPGYHTIQELLGWKPGIKVEPLPDDFTLLGRFTQPESVPW